MLLHVNEGGLLDLLSFSADVPGECGDVEEKDQQVVAVYDVADKVPGPPDLVPRRLAVCPPKKQKQPVSPRSEPSLSGDNLDACSPYP